MRVSAPAEVNGLQLTDALEDAGFGNVLVVYFESGELEITGDGVDEDARAEVERVVAEHQPAVPTPVPPPVPKIEAEFDRLIDTLVEKRQLSEADRRKIREDR